MTKPRPMDEQKKSVIWREWERGTPMTSIARVIDKPPATVFSYLQYHGGIRPRQRVRAVRALSLEEREEISRGISHGVLLHYLRAYRCPALDSRLCGFLEQVSNEFNFVENAGLVGCKMSLLDSSECMRRPRPIVNLLAVGFSLS